MPHRPPRQRRSRQATCPRVRADLPPRGRLCAPPEDPADMVGSGAFGPGSRRRQRRGHPAVDPRADHHRRHAKADSQEPVTIKKYANRRFYNTGTSTYVTLDDLARYGEGGPTISSCSTPRPATTSPTRCSHGSSSSRRTRKIQKPSADRAPAADHPVLRRQHADAGARAISSISIGRLTASRRSSAPGYQAFGSGPFDALDDQVRRNTEMFERAFAMFMPFAKREAQTAADADKAATTAPGGRRGDRRSQAADGRDAETARSPERRTRIPRTRRRATARLAGTAMRDSCACRHGVSADASPTSAPCR